MATYTPQKRLRFDKTAYQYGDTAPHRDDFSSGRLYFMGIIRSDETVGYYEPIRGHTSRYDPSTVGSTPYPMTWIFWPYYSDGSHQFYLWVDVNGTPTRYGVSFGDAIWNSLGTTRIFEVVWDRDNHMLLAFVNGKYMNGSANVNTNANLGNPLWDTDSSIMRIGAAPSPGAATTYLNVKYELLIIHNDFPWWYVPGETVYHRMDHFLYLDTTNPIPVGTEPGDPNQWLHCYLFNEVVNGTVPDLGSAGVDFTLYNTPTLETGLSGIWVDTPPPLTETYLDCSYDPAQTAPATFLFHATLNGELPGDGSVSWHWKEKNEPVWHTITGGNATFTFDGSTHGNAPGVYYVKAEIEGDMSEPVKVSIIQYPLSVGTLGIHMGEPAYPYDLIEVLQKNSTFCYTYWGTEEEPIYVSMWAIIDDVVVGKNKLEPVLDYEVISQSQRGSMKWVVTRTMSQTGYYLLEIKSSKTRGVVKRIQIRVVDSTP